MLKERMPSAIPEYATRNVFKASDQVSLCVISMRHCSGMLNKVFAPGAECKVNLLEQFSCRASKSFEEPGYAKIRSLNSRFFHPRLSQNKADV